MKHFPVEAFPASFPVISHTGEILGYVDKITRKNGQISVVGWTVADEVGLCSEGLRISTAPTLRRVDVVTVHPGLASTDRGDQLGFHIKTDLKSAEVRLFLRAGHETHYIYLG